MRNLRSRGLIEGARFGRNLMFTERSVEKFIKDQFDRQNMKKGQHWLTKETKRD